MKRILILTSDYGYGHRSVANAIAAALHESYGPDCTGDVVNPLNDPGAPAFLRENQAHYDRLVRERPELYAVGYRVADGPMAGDLVETAWLLMLFNVLRDIIRRTEPDVIVCTYLYYQGVLPAIFALEKRRIPLLTVVTDLATVSRLWFHPAADLCLVPTQQVYDLAIAAGLPAEKIKITGIPVRPELGQPSPDRASLRQALGWHPDLFTVLAIGSQRVGHLYESLRVLNHSGLPLQLAVVAGGDAELLKRCEETDWHVKTHVYGYVHEMPTFMRAADCVLSKAGGVTVSEALACELPLMLVDVIPGQETGNAALVLGGDAGVLARNPVEVLEGVCHWLEQDRAGYHRQVEAARRLARPRAAWDAAALIWAAAEA